MFVDPAPDADDLLAGLLGAYACHPPRPTYNHHQCVTTPSGVCYRRLAPHEPEEPCRGSILYAHGNAEDVGCAHGAELLARMSGMAVYVFDPPGYGRTPGTLGTGWLSSALDVLECMPERPRVAYGYSMGAWAATCVAAREGLVDALVTEAGFMSLLTVAAHMSALPWVLRYGAKLGNATGVDCMCTIDAMRNVRCPVLVVHGTNDALVPRIHAFQLSHAAGTRLHTMIMTDGAHTTTLIRGASRVVAAMMDMAGIILTSCSDSSGSHGSDGSDG